MNFRTGRLVTFASGSVYASPLLACGPEGYATFLVGIPGVIVAIVVLWAVGSLTNSVRASTVVLMVALAFAASMIPDLRALLRAQHSEELIAIFAALVSLLIGVFARNMVVQKKKRAT